MSDLILLQTFFHKHDAQIAIGLLREAGIEAILQSDDAGGFRPHLTLAMGNNRVMVHKKDAPRALEVIEPLQQDFSEDEMKEIERMALESELPPEKPLRKRKKPELTILIPLGIAALFVLSYLFQEIHQKKVVVEGEYTSYVRCLNTEFEGRQVLGCKSYYFNWKLMGERFYWGKGIVGPAKEYYPNGQLLWEGNYVNNRLMGPAKEYYESGTLKAEMNYKNGQTQGEYHAYYESGPLMYRVWYEDNKADGVWQTFYEDGTLAREDTFKDGYYLDTDGNLFTGTYTIRHPNGRLWEEIPYRAGRINGTRRLFHTDGSLKKSQQYRNGDLHGTINEFYPNNQVKLHEEYRNGDFKSVKMYDHDGNLIWKEQGWSRH